MIENEPTIKAKLNLLNGLLNWIYLSFTKIVNKIPELSKAAIELASAKPVWPYPKMIAK